MPAVGETLRVEGYRDLQRAFKVADKRLHGQLRSNLKGVAEPVKADAERLAVEEISHIGLKWSKMRIGVTMRSLYVAPLQRGVKTKGRQRFHRPNLAELLLNKALIPALERNEALVVREMEALLDDIGQAWEAA